MAAALDIDAYTYSQTATFQHRVQMALVATAVAVTTEAATVAFHVDRARFAQEVLLNPTAYVGNVSLLVAMDATVNSKIASGGATGTDTDTDLSNALSAAWNSLAEKF